jgi:hypothetical protein
MWIGRPPFTVSVAKIRRLVAGGLNGVPSTSTMAARVARSVSRRRNPRRRDDVESVLVGTLE